LDFLDFHRHVDKMAINSAVSDQPHIRAPSNPASSARVPTEDEKLRESFGTPNDSNDALPEVEKGRSDNERPPATDNRFLVEFEGPNDPGNPKNWTAKRRWAITISMGLLVFTVTFASSIFSVNIRTVQELYNVELVTATLGVALFVLGFVFGPIAFGPMSEVLGRKIPLFSGFALFAIFQIPVALAQNITTICVGRFLGGFFASAPLAVVGGALADLWDPIPRSYAICVFAAGGFAGPVAGPIAGGFITESHLGWRWTSWITLIMAGFLGTVGFFVIPETSGARILQLRAAKLRKDTGNTQYYSKADENKLTMNKVVNVYLLRPFVMFLQEPILALITAYMSFLYGIVYLLFEAVSCIPYGGSSILIAFSTATNFTKAYVKHGKSIPEERLPPMIVGAIALPIGLFWFAWTSSPNISWVPQVLSIALLGLGCMVPFWQGMSYLIDCYGFYSNSAIAVNTFIRSFFGAFFPLFTHAMYHNLGVPWASSLLGFICVLFLPVPVLFYIYGARIRAKSKWAPTAP
jgi:DHA1 family multidrug resistance protein-like MFS transporter